MRNELANTPNSNNLRDIPVTSPAQSEFKSFLNHFWNMLDFSNHGESNELQPKIEVSENNNDVTVTAEMPGVNEKDIDLQISSDGYLTLCGEKKESNERNEKGNYFSEIYYGSFKRTIPLPWDLDYDKADAQYNDGILTIAIPKTQNERTKMKKINVSKGRKDTPEANQTRN